MNAADTSTARANMVEKQIRPNQVTDRRIFDAMLDVPRETFVPDAKRGIAYIEDLLEVRPGRFLLAPMVFARLMQEARIRSEDRILDVGCLTGYSSAVLARIGRHVTAIDCDSDLVEEARKRLAGPRADNIEVRAVEDLRAGYPESGPYDVILCEGSVDLVPESLRAQLADGGRLMAIVSRSASLGEAMLFERAGEVVSGRVLFEATVPRLPGFAREQGFVFA